MMAVLSPGVFSFAASRKKFLAAAASVALVASASGAEAQLFDRAQTNVSSQGAEAAPNNDTSSLLRIDRLESQVRSLNGEVEQLQFQVKRLEDQLRKFQMDVDSRFQDSSAARPGSGASAPRPASAATPQKRSNLMDTDPMAPASDVADSLPSDDAQGVAANPAVAIDSPLATPVVAMSPDGHRHDAFDPEAQPNAPGAPLPLGSPESASKPVERVATSPSGPLDLTPPALRGANPTVVATAEAPNSGSSSATLQPAAPAAASVDPIKADYDAAADQLRSQHYDAAQQAFSAFVQKNPHSRLIAPAIYHLGESYYYQGRHREAAEQFLKIATDFAKSPVAPDAMVKLGVSLNALGAKEQACAFFSEMPRKYPNAPPAQKLAAEREAKKASC